MRKDQVLNSTRSTIRTVSAKRRSLSSSRNSRILNAVDLGKEHFLMQYNKQRVMHRTFRLTEQVVDMYKKNINLQKKLDDIKSHGTGINNVRQIKPKSLNYIASKHETNRINRENLKLANRLVNQTSQLNYINTPVKSARNHSAKSRNSSTIDMDRMMARQRLRI